MSDSTETYEVSEVLLGFQPYLLIQFRTGDEGPEDLRAVVECGGGLEGMDDIGTTLAMVLSDLPEAANPLIAALDELAAEDGMAEPVRRVREAFGWVDQ